MDCAAQSMDPCFARAVHGLPSLALPPLRKEEGSGNTPIP